VVRHHTFLKAGVAHDSAQGVVTNAGRNLARPLRGAQGDIDPIVTA